MSVSPGDIAIPLDRDDAADSHLERVARPSVMELARARALRSRALDEALAAAEEAHGPLTDAERSAVDEQWDA